MLVLSIGVEELGVHRQHAVEVERSDAQKLARVDHRVLSAEDLGVGVDALDLLLELVELGRLHEIGLVQQDAVCKGNLLHCLVLNSLRLLLLQVFHAVLAVDNCDNAVELVLGADEVINKEGLGHWCWIRKACGFDEHSIEGLHLLVEPLQGLDQVAADGAADAAVHHLDDLFVSLLCQHLLVHTHLTELILNDGEAQLVLR
mmetsp:Transcript_1629/g.3548  ORF Transcript_1629/g.3548 Transcript_1629/m.3548 type:complete len:202 (+) Transcript_1629:805-1410(+)